MSKQKLQIGDLFSIKIGEQYAIGQIVVIRSKRFLGVVIFDGLYKDYNILDIEELVESEILFFATTFDIFIVQLKKWEVFNNYLPNVQYIPLPYYKVNTPNGYVVTDYDGRNSNVNINKYENKLNYKNTVSCVWLENAIKAYYKILPWDADYDRLLYSNLITELE